MKPRIHQFTKGSNKHELYCLLPEGHDKTKAHPVLYLLPVDSGRANGEGESGTDVNEIQRTIESVLSDRDQSKAGIREQAT